MTEKQAKCTQPIAENIAARGPNVTLLLAEELTYARRSRRQGHEEGVARQALLLQGRRAFDVLAAHSGDPRSMDALVLFLVESPYGPEAAAALRRTTKASQIQWILDGLLHPRTLTARSDGAVGLYATWWVLKDALPELQPMIAQLAEGAAGNLTGLPGLRALDLITLDPQPVYEPILRSLIQRNNGGQPSQEQVANSSARALARIRPVTEPTRRMFAELAERGKTEHLRRIGRTGLASLERDVDLDARLHDVFQKTRPLDARRFLALIFQWPNGEHVWPPPRDPALADRTKD